MPLEDLQAPGAEGQGEWSGFNGAGPAVSLAPHSCMVVGAGTGGGGGAAVGMGACRHYIITCLLCVDKSRILVSPLLAYAHANLQFFAHHLTSYRLPQVCSTALHASCSTSLMNSSSMRLIGSLFVGPVFVAVAKPAQQNAILLAGFHILSLHTGVFAIQADKAIFEGGGGGEEE